MHTQESNNIYIEKIYELSLYKKTVKAIDIANELSYSRASVSRAIKKLSNDNYINIDSSYLITLTQKGIAIAQKLELIRNFLKTHLIQIGVPINIAEIDASRMEHCISNETFEIIKRKFSTAKQVEI